MSSKNKTHIKAYLSITLTLLLTFSLLTGVFSPKTEIPGVRAATALTNVSNTLTSTQISATTTHQINFTTYTDIPIDGKIVITFPSGFNVTSTSFNSWSGLDGSQTISTSSQTITVTRDGAGTASAAGSKYIKLDNIVNSSATGTSYTVTVETQDSTGTTLDGPTTSYYFSVCANACHTSTYHIPWVSTISTSTTHTTRFTAASAIPASGKVKITFPAGFDISSASTTQLNGGGTSYDLTQSISGQTITITNASTTAIAAGANYVVIAGIINPSVAGNYYVTVETASSSDANIEGPTAIRFPISDLGLADTAWPMYGHDQRHTGRSPYSGPSYPAIYWAYNASGASQTPTITPDGKVCFRAGRYLYKLNSDGSLIWTYDATQSIEDSPAVDSEGNIYVGLAGNVTVISIDQDGNYRWGYPTPPGGGSGGFGSSIVISSDGTLYTPRYTAGYLYAIYPDGRLKWQSGIGGGSYSSPAIDTSGNIYVGQINGVLYKFDPSGTQVWTYNAGYSGSYAGFWRGNPTIGDDGTVYIGRKNNYTLYAINSDGTLKWTYATGGILYRATPSLSNDGQAVYLGSADQKLHAVDISTGNLSWSYTLDGTPLLPTVDKNNNILIGTSGKSLYALDQEGQFIWKYAGGGDMSLGYPIIDDNNVMYATYGSGLYAFRNWTLSATVNPSGYYQTGDTITFTASTTMLATDAVTSEANQVQAYLENGAAVPLTYSTTSGDYTIWTGTYVVPSTTTDGTYTATIEAAAVNVVTDTTVHFASPPTNSTSSNGTSTGITGTVNYVVDSTAPTGSSLSFSSLTQDSITLSLSGAQDALAGLADLPYYFERDNGTAYSGWQSATSWQDSGLDCCKHYTYKVKVKDKAGNIQEVSQTQQATCCAVIMPPIAFMPPVPPPSTTKNPQGGFRVLINDGAKFTDNRTVILKLFAGSDAERMAISENSDFYGAGQEPYQTTKAWTLSEGDGEKTIYVKFYNQWGRASEIVSDSIILETPEQPKVVEKAPTKEQITKEVAEQTEIVATMPIQEIKAKILEIQQEIIELITQLIQLIQDQIANLQKGL